VVSRDRGQGHTLEAVVAAFLLVASITFALQMTAVTPLSASTSSQHRQNQLRGTGAGVLASVADADGLSTAIRYWNDSDARFFNTPDGGYYTNDPPNNAFGHALNRTFDERNATRTGAVDGGRTLISGTAQPHEETIEAPFSGTETLGWRLWIKERDLTAENPDIEASAVGIEPNWSIETTDENATPFVVDDGRRRDINEDPPVEQGTISEETVTEHLEALGYK
jgi:hypothetical protein